jgi:hypothetical protein
MSEGRQLRASLKAVQAAKDRLTKAYAHAASPLVPVAGTELQARPKSFLALYGHHMEPRHHEAIRIIRDAWELEERIKAGVQLNDGERWRLGAFQRAWDRFSRHNLEWAWRIRKLVLDEEDESTGRMVSAAALGASRTRYGIGSDSAKAAGVAFVMDALDVFLEADYVIRIEARLAQTQKLQELERAATEVVLASRAKRIPRT